MSDGDEATVYPLLAFGTGPAHGAVVLGLEMATDPGQFERRAGLWVHTAIAPDHAIALGEMLIELGRRLQTGDALH